jgi:hypothetical protein
MIRGEDDLPLRLRFKRDPGLRKSICIKSKIKFMLVGYPPPSLFYILLFIHPLKRYMDPIVAHLFFIYMIIYSTTMAFPMELPSLMILGASSSDEEDNNITLNDLFLLFSINIDLRGSGLTLIHSHFS